MTNNNQLSITIPPEALEAAARAMAKAGYGFAGIELTDPYTADAEYWDHIAHAAIRAALAAWPGMKSANNAEDGYDVYAAAREEYRKKIAEQAAENEKLRAELWDIHAICNNYPHFFWWPVHRIKRRVRAALGGKDE